MGLSDNEKGASSAVRGDGLASAEARKAAERLRLAEALRANLRRRKAQSREREARDAGGTESGAATQKD